jgi:uncharacterized membrane protein
MTKSIPVGTRWDVLGAKFFPRLVLVFIAGMSLVVLLMSSRDYLRSKDMTGERQQTHLKEYKEIYIIFLSMLAYLAALEIIGFLLASFFFLFFLQWYLSEGKPSFQHFLIAFLTAGILYFIFTRFLNVLLPSGLLGFEL